MSDRTTRLNLFSLARPRARFSSLARPRARFSSLARPRARFDAATKGSHLCARLTLLLCLSGASVLCMEATHGRAHASLVEALDLPALVAEADRVLLARVMSQASHYDPEGQIVTDFAMQVEEAIKGDEAPGAAITVRRLGGVVGDIGMRVAGEPSFEVGETVLLFGAHGADDSALRPVGMAQGALRVFEKDGTRWVRSAGNGVAAVRRAGGQLKSAPLAVEQPRRLDALLSEVRGLVAAQKKR